MAAMDTQQILYFLALCEEESFTRAAKKCGIAQPSLTIAIRRLENEIGGTLFLRAARPPYAQLTPLGVRLRPICVQMRKLLKKAASVVN